MKCLIESSGYSSAAKKIMFTKSKYIALGIIIGLGLANLFPFIKEPDSPARFLLKILPFILLLAMLIYTSYLMKRHDKEKKG